MANVGVARPSRLLIALGSLTLAFGLLAVTPPAYADQSPAPTRDPIAQETPGGAGCLPGGPSTGCASESPSPSSPRTPTASPRPSTPAAPVGTATPTHPVRPVAPSRSATPTAPAPTRTGAAGPVATKPAAGRSAAPRPTATVPAVARPATPAAAAIAPQAEPVSYEQPAASVGSSTAPGWVGPIVAGLLVLLCAVLLAGPGRRRLRRVRRH